MKLFLDTTVPTFGIQTQPYEMIASETQWLNASRLKCSSLLHFRDIQGCQTMCLKDTITFGTFKESLSNIGFYPFCSGCKQHSCYVVREYKASRISLTVN